MRAAQDKLSKPSENLLRGLDILFEIDVQFGELIDIPIQETGCSIEPSLWNLPVKEDAKVNGCYLSSSSNLCYCWHISQQTGIEKVNVRKDFS